jgi:hypothetical protein
VNNANRRQQISAITSRFHLCECVPCAAAIPLHLSPTGYSSNRARKAIFKIPNLDSTKINIPSSQSSDKVILFFSQDEHTALEQFFKLFNKFVHADNHSEIESVDTQSAIARP